MVGSASSRSKGKKKYGRSRKKSGKLSGGYTKMYALATAGVVCLVAIFGFLLFARRRAKPQSAASRCTDATVPIGTSQLDLRWLAHPVLATNFGIAPRGSRAA